MYSVNIHAYSMINLLTHSPDPDLVIQQDLLSITYNVYTSITKHLTIIIIL